MAWWERVALVAILVAAAALRLAGLDWDGFHHHHPDERYIIWVATTIEFPSTRASWSAVFNPNTSTFNPFRWPPGASSEGIVVLQDEPRDFAYGHVPLYLGVAATRFAERLGPALLPVLPAGWALARDALNGAGRIEFHHMAAVGRFLAALFDTGAVLLVFLLGRRLYGTAAGLLAGAFLGLTVLHIQSAHFFISDPFLAFFVTAALRALVETLAAAGERRSPRRVWAFLLLGAALAGLAVGSKFTAVLLFLPLAFAAWRTGIGKPGRRAGRVAAVALAMGLVFAVTNPFAVLDWTCGGVGAATSNCYLQNVLTQNGMVSGRSDLAFTRQFEGTIPYLYPIEMQARWGMSLFLALAAFAGFGWAVWQGIRSLNRRAARSWRDDALLALLLWAVPYSILTGAFYAKFIRYALPVAPLLMVFAAGMIMGCRPKVRAATAAVVLTTAGLYALAFVAVYREPHPWDAASAWIYDNIPSGTLILSEQFDDYLPVTMEVGGDWRQREEYPNAELTWLAGTGAADDEAKLQANLERLAGAEYLTVLSNRVYGVVPRLSERYPLSSRYYPLLFGGELGYEAVWVGGRFPNLGGVSLKPDSFGWPGLQPPAAVAEFLGDHPGPSFGRADESFTVYDQPLTMIFRNTGHLTATEMRAKFEAEE